MPWLQLHLTVKDTEAARLEAVLESLGAQSVTLRDSGDRPVLEPGVGETPLWPEIRADALFEANADRVLIRAELEKHFEPAQLALVFEELADRAWEREWLQYFAPIQCGRRLWVCPVGQQPPDPDAVILQLDPGLAFGTGTHETTRLCLAWLDSADLQGTRVLDFGCGSGILGIAALLLGAAHVTFSDIDPQALQATRDNLARNALAGADHLVCPSDAFTPDGQAPFDLVLANILAGPLVELAPMLQRCLGAGGQIALSGLRAAQAGAVQAAYTSTIEFDVPAQQNGWLRLTGIRQ